MIEFILSFDFFELVIQFDALIFFEDDSQCFFMLFVVDCIDALHFCATNKNKRILSPFWLIFYL